MIYFQPTRLLEFPWRITQVWFKDIRVAMAQGYLSILNLVVPQWIRQLCCLIRLPPAALLQLAIPPTGHPHVWPPNKSMMTGQPPESPEFELRLGKFWRKEAGLEIADCVVLLLGKNVYTKLKHYVQQNPTKKIKKVDPLILKHGKAITGIATGSYWKIFCKFGVKKVKNIEPNRPRVYLLTFWAATGRCVPWRRPSFMRKHLDCWTATHAHLRYGPAEWH